MTNISSPIELTIEQLDLVTGGCGCEPLPPGLAKNDHIPNGLDGPPDGWFQGNADWKCSAPS